MSARDAALAYAANGRHVLPVGQHKKPITEHGLLDATTDPDVIRRWFTRPGVLLAIRTGQISGLVALDVDDDAGAESLAELEREHGPLPDTCSVKTPSGGEHYWFRWPGQPVKTSAGQLGAGLDMRGDGGYAIVPPSPGYEFDSLSAFAQMPDWLLALAGVAEHSPPEATDPGVWVSMLRDGVPHGQRDVAMTRIVGHLYRRYVDVDLVTLIAHSINRVCWRPPMRPEHVERILDSVAGIEARR